MDLTTLLHVDGIDVYYRDFQALYGVSLTVRPGCAVALVGANGAGKTTLLRTIAGGNAASSGTISYDGHDITREPPHRRIARGIVLVPEGRRLFASLTVEENILVGAAARKDRDDWPLQRIYDTFPVIARRRTHRASQLSGGEQQAVAISRALAASPSLLLLDEISLGLSPLIVGALYQTLAALRETGTTMILVEQDLSRALSVCDDVVCLLEGRVSLTAPATVSRDEVVAAYFGDAA
jgi:branched-chain amino acid transport system ATP-binding protein